jgi:putative endonuclease
VTTTSKGRAGEDLAVLFLERTGYAIVGRNVRAGGYEIDVIARDGDVLCFVEVRRRKRTDDALASVDGKKQARVARAASAYLAKSFGPAAMPRCRFDVVVIAANRVDLVRGAFEATR